MRRLSALSILGALTGLAGAVALADAPALLEARLPATAALVARRVALLVEPSVAVAAAALAEPSAPPPRAGDADLERAGSGAPPRSVDGEVSAMHGAVEPGRLRSEVDVEPGAAQGAVETGAEGLASNPPRAGDAQVLVSIASETPIRAEPAPDAKKIGYLRAGDAVARAAAPAGTAGCKGGYYAIEPEGFVCAGAAASLEPDHPIARAASARPERESPLPYAYGLTRAAAPYIYTRVPTGAGPSRAAPMCQPLGGFGLSLGEVPEFLRDGGTSYSLSGYRYSSERPHLGQALPRSGFAITRAFESGGRSFGVTPELHVLDLACLQRVEPSRFHGTRLADGVGLPVVFVLSHSALAYTGSPATGLQLARRLGFREAVPITGRRERRGANVYLETRGGEWLQDRRLVRVDAARSSSAWAQQGRRWLDVSISRQTLVAYQGSQPVFVTLVSTGADGIVDHEGSHATIQGEFAIHTKHVSVTMSGDEPGDEFELGDVPWVQYFSGGYALHATYWHDGFGSPRSHGCINLSPVDARWLFEWTTPRVPKTWHGAMSLRDGTLVSIHP